MSSKEQRKLVLSLQREQKQKQKKQRKEEEKDERKKERAKRREMCGTVRNSAEQCAKHDLCPVRLMADKGTKSTQQMLAKIREGFTDRNKRAK